jgi:hypothetical protein
VAHLNDGTLRRMFDDPDANVGADAAHLASCPECEARFKTIAGDARSVATLLAVPDAKVDVTRAFAGVSGAAKARPALGLRFPIVRPAARPALALVAAVTALALVVVAFTFSGLFFQPTKVKTVPVTVADVEALSQLAEYGTLKWTTRPDLHIVTSAGDASAVAGFSAPAVSASTLPKGVSTNITYAAMPQAQAVFTFSAEKAAASAAAHGKQLPSLPAGMDGATLTITAGPAVAEVYGNLNQPQSATNTSEVNLPQLVVAKSVTPTATSTQVTVRQLEDYILAQPGISVQLKNAIKAVDDPSTTLLIPVPVQYATSTQVTVQGVEGVALGDNTGLGSAVVWVKSGYVYAVAGSIKQTDALNIANNLK